MSAITKPHPCLCTACSTGNSCSSTPGYLAVAFGNMFSGKTSYLLRQLGQWVDLGEEVFYINHSFDSRSEGAVSTHSSHSQLSPKIKTTKCNSLSDVNVAPYRVIAVDEAQFFDDLIPSVCRWVDEMGKIVYVVGLDGDYRRQRFGKILDLIPYADEVQKLTAVCTACIKDRKFSHNLPRAPFTHRRLSEGQGEGQVLIGAAETYEPLCRFHYLTS